MRKDDHHDAKIETMRTTVVLDDDVVAAIEQDRRKNGGGLSASVNRLIRKGLRVRQESRRFRQRTEDLGLRIDVTNVAEALEQLETHSR